MFGRHRTGLCEKAFVPFRDWSTVLDKAAWPLLPPKSGWRHNLPPEPVLGNK